METILQYKNIDGTWFLSTPFTYDLPQTFITGSADIPRLNIDPRTLFRIRHNFAIHYPEYFIRWAYLEENKLVRLHLTISPLIENIEEKCLQLQNLISSRQFPETWYPVFSFSNLSNPTFARHTFQHLNISNVKYKDDICYLDLDNISNLNNYMYIYTLYNTQLLKIYDYSLKSSLFYSSNREFVRRYNLRIANTRDFENLIHFNFNDRSDVIILDSQILNLKLEIYPENCYFPVTDFDWGFYYNRFQQLPCYFWIPDSLVIHYDCAKIISNMWVINGYIQLNINNDTDLSIIEKLRQTIYSAVGTVDEVDEIDKTKNIVTYYRGEERKKINLVKNR